MATLRSARTTYKNTRNTTDAWCVRVERQDGEIIRYTNSVQNLAMTQRVDADGNAQNITEVIYHSLAGYNPTAIASQDNLNAGLVDIEGILDTVSASVSETRSIQHLPPNATASITSAGDADNVIDGLKTASDPTWKPGASTNVAPSFIEFDFKQPVKFNKVIVYGLGDTVFWSIRKSDDGYRFDEVTSQDEQADEDGGTVVKQTVVMPYTVRSRYIRAYFGVPLTLEILEVEFFLDTTPTGSGTIARTDIENGLYDNARVFVFMTDYTAPFEDDEKMLSGYWGNAELRDGTYVAEFKSLIDSMSYRFGRRYTSACDAVFGSFRCGIHLDPPDWTLGIFAYAKDDFDASSGTWVKPTTPNGFYFYASVGGSGGISEPTWPTSAGGTVVDSSITWTAVRAFRIPTTIATVVDSRTITVTAISGDANDTWTAGICEFTDNVLEGVKTTIESQTSTTIVFAQPLKTLPTAGDAITLTQGCRKRFAEDCKTKFDNALNHQGFPYIPGAKILTKFGGQN